MNAGYHAVGVCHRVEDPTAAANFLRDALGFRIETSGRDRARVENGDLLLELLPLRPEDEPQDLTLEVVTSDLEATRTRLGAFPQVIAVEPEGRPTVERRVQRVITAHQMVLALTCELSEDDLGILPPLPARLAWDEQGDRLVRELLRQVPLAQRHDARRRATEEAERLARTRGDGRVRVGQALRGLAGAVPGIKSSVLWRALADHGVGAGGTGTERDEL
jgi:hypothetical protein